MKQQYVWIGSYLAIIYIESYYDQNGLDFAVAPILQGRSLEILFIMEKTACWRSIHAHYLVTSNEHIFADSFSAGADELFGLGS